MLPTLNIAYYVIVCYSYRFGCQKSYSITVISFLQTIASCLKLGRLLKRKFDVHETLTYFFFESFTVSELRPQLCTQPFSLIISLSSFIAFLLFIGPSFSAFSGFSEAQSVWVLVTTTEARVTVVPCSSCC